jgi:signal peptidase II
MAILLAGIWGNAIDGVVRGYVIDMLHSHWLTAIHQPLFGTRFPTFNVADIGITVGGPLMLLAFRVWQPKKPMPSREASSSNSF